MNLVIPEKTVAVDPPQESVSERRYPRIGGVLIFVAIGLFISLIQNLTYFLASLLPVVRKPLWEALTNPASSAYHSYWKPFLVYEFAASLFLLLTNLVVLVLFFLKKSWFPKTIVALLPTIFILTLVSYYFSSSIPAMAESADYAKQGTTLIIRFIGLHIWIPYFLLSKRVKTTFVR